jgi:hypothetical protein
MVANDLKRLKDSQRRAQVALQSATLAQTDVEMRHLAVTLSEDKSISLRSCPQGLTAEELVARIIQ